MTRPRQYAGPHPVMYRSGWRHRGVYAPHDPFYVLPEVADQIEARPTALEEFYA